MVRDAFLTSEDEVSVIPLNAAARLLGVLFIAAILGIGIFPEAFMNLAKMAAGTLL